MPLLPRKDAIPLTKFAAGLLFIFVCSFRAMADGEQDNNPLTVRQIPRPGIAVPADREQSLRKRLSELQQKIGRLKKLKSRETKALLPDVMIFERAVRCALDYDEFFSAKDIDRADRLMDEGQARADQLLQGNPAWPQQAGLVVRGYVSRIDQTVQPYGLVIPQSYDFRRSRPARCDIWFHGRGETLSEVNFISGRMTTVGQYAPEDTIVLHPYGRYSNAFKFAGETDVFEALEDVQRRYRIDADRISVRGFSMGGAACWQFAVHYADRWFAANPGAGFSETPQFLKFFQKETLHPAPWEQTLWNLYDCNRYALNLVHCPTIAYSGENDIQKQAADVMEVAMKKHGLNLRHVIGPGMGHRIDDVSKATIDDAMNRLAQRGRQSVPRHIVFETHTLRYQRMHWLSVDGLFEHWKPARMDLVLTTDRSAENPLVVGESQNVSRFTVRFPPGTFLAGSQNESPKIADEKTGHRTLPQEVTVSVVNQSQDAGQTPRRKHVFRGPIYSDGSAVVRAVLKSDDETAGALRKRHGLQGPVDDALMDAFVFVRPTGQAANALPGTWAESELQRAIVHWRRHFRGDARVVDDHDVTDDLIQSANLILWGDPTSNSMIAKIADRLPMTWSETTITVGSTEYDASDHAPILIYPNPLNPDRYVVLNSSFTYRDYAYLNNARQVPMLPDWAIVDLKTPPGNVWPGNIVAADFFNEEWKLK